MSLLTGKVALITGAASGIGAAAARRFSAEGAKLILTDIAEAPLRALAESIGPDVMFSQLDVADEAATAKVVADGVARFGGIDVAVLNVGVTGTMAPIGKTETESFAATMTTNVTGAFIGLKYVMEAMTGRGGAIVMTASTAGFRAGAPGRWGYVTSKHAVVGLMRCAAAEGAPLGIRVNSISPGGVDTPMTQSLKTMVGEEKYQEAMAGFVRTIPLGRIGQPEDIADAMLFFASDLSRYCSGTNLMVDGGLMG